MSRPLVVSFPAELATVMGQSRSSSTTSLRQEAGRLALPTGVTLEYVDRGAAAGQPIVMLHGLSDSYRSFDLLAPHLRPGVRMIAPSLRGHGDSDRPAGRCSMRAMAADVAALMDLLRAAPAVIVGHSMGSRVALRLALDHPSHVRKLVLVGGFAPGLPNAALDDLVATAEALPARLPFSFAREFQLGCLAAPVSPAFVSGMIEQTLKVPTGIFREALAAFIADDMPAALPRIDVPVQLMWGMRDAFVSQADQQALMEALPDARLRAYEGIGHTPQWECPERFAADLMTFCEAPATR